MAHGKKTGGRRAGTPNKTTAELRQQIQTIVEAAIIDLPTLLSDMEPDERVKALNVLLPYVMPKLSSVEISGNDGGAVRVTLNLNPAKT